MQYRMRLSALSMLLVIASLDMLDKNRSLTDWALLAALFLSYPHIQYWRTCRSANALKAELSHLVVDPIVIGVLLAASGLSLWISFAAILGTLMDNVTNKGWKTVPETILGFLAGALIWVSFRGFSLSLDSCLPVALGCIIGLSGYLLVMSNSGYLRHAQLRKTRKDLRIREAELLAVNATLTAQLHENSELQNLLKEQNSHDSLTGLYNRRYLDSVMDIHMARSKRDGSALAFIMIDIDYFKDYNDCYGHQAGDECLKRVALSLRASIQRASDLTARFGGEEFLMILPNTTRTSAQDLANEVQQSIAALNIPHERSTFGKVTISVGFAVMVNNSYPEVADLLHAADDALYCAKNNGRNLVVFAGDTQQESMAPRVQGR